MLKHAFAACAALMLTALPVAGAPKVTVTIVEQPPGATIPPGQGAIMIRRAAPPMAPTTKPRKATKPGPAVYLHHGKVVIARVGCTRSTTAYGPGKTTDLSETVSLRMGPHPGFC